MNYLWKPRIIKGLLNSSEREELRQSIHDVRKHLDSRDDAILFEWWSRLNHRVDIPDSVMKKFQDVAIEQGGAQDLYMTDHASFRYDIQYGLHTQLPPHIDAPGNQLQMDYQFESNISWPLYIEGERFVLEDNDVLMFAGGYQMHWREVKTLNPGEFVDMFDISFAVKDFQKRYDSGEFAVCPDDYHTRYTNITDTLYKSNTNICISMDQVDHSRCNHDTINADKSKFNYTD